MLPRQPHLRRKQRGGNNQYQTMRKPKLSIRHPWVTGVPQDHAMGRQRLRQQSSRYVSNHHVIHRSDRIRSSEVVRSSHCVGASTRLKSCSELFSDRCLNLNFGVHSANQLRRRAPTTTTLSASNRSFWVGPWTDPDKQCVPLGSSTALTVHLPDLSRVRRRKLDEFLAPANCDMFV